MMAEEEITQKDGTKRKPTYGDFCILMRGVKSHAPAFEEELLKMGIPSVSETSDSFFERHEIMVMMSLLRIIDNPVLDIPLAAVLLSPIFGFTADELAGFRSRSPEGSLYSLILNENALGNEKTLAFTQKLSKLRRFAARASTETLINKIYLETSYPEIVSAGEDGDFKKNNLKLLVHYAKSYESSGYRGVGGFVRFIDRLRENSVDLAAAERKTAVSENAVAIMTIHKSKGLEWPICIAANLNRRFNTDTKNEVLLHNELGLGVRRKDDALLCRYTTMPREAVSLEIKRNEMSEELRVLYVAMTRARERLVLVGSVRDPEKYLSGVVKKLAYDQRTAPYSVSKAVCMCDWIAYCAIVHKDGGELRRLGGYIGEIYKGDTAGWDMFVIDDLTEYYEKSIFRKIPGESETNAANAGFEAAAKEEYLRLIRERLGRKYEYDKLSAVPVKVAASQLAHRGKPHEYSLTSVPAFLQKDHVSGAERGTAMHTFAQYCDIANAGKDLEKEIKRLVEKGFLSQLQGEIINRKNLYSFLNSKLCGRMLESEKVEREFRFTVEIPAGLADDSLEFPFSEEPIVLQGAVDCLFEENGKIVIVDYKSDYNKTPQQLCEMYSKQLKLYKLAVESVTGKIVSQLIIYSFAASCEINVEI